MNYKTSDGWFYAADMSDPNAVQTVRAVFTTIQSEAQAAARNPHPHGMWPAAESLGYKPGCLSWELFSTAYLNTLARIQGAYVRKMVSDDFQSWIDQLQEHYLGE